MAISSDIITNKVRYYRPILYAAIIIVGCVVITCTLINPLWLSLNLHVPGEPESKVDFTQPVDTVFYVRNAEYGYNWNITDPISSAFHPLLVWATRLLPNVIAANYRLWFISLVSAFISLILLYEYINEISSIKLPAEFLFLVPILPGGISIATGNAEFSCLLFTTLMLLGVIRRWPWYLVMCCGVLAILTKPNALYIVPALAVYAFLHQNIQIYFRTLDPAALHESIANYIFKSEKEKNSNNEIISKHSYTLGITQEVSLNDIKVTRNCIFGISGIIITWLLWTIYVDINLGQFGSYWEIRKFYTVPLSAGPFSLLQRTVSLLFQYSNLGEQLKFATAILIPLIHIWLLSCISLKNERHRLAILASILAMMFIAFQANNPNKIIVYVITYPGNFAIGIIFLYQAFYTNESKYKLRTIWWRLGGISYIVFCVAMVAFYIIGTPLAWYY